MLQSTGSQRVGHDRVTELTERNAVLELESCASSQCFPKRFTSALEVAQDSAEVL